MNLELVRGICYIIASIFFVFGLKMLSSPTTARRGNLVSAIGMLIAVVTALSAMTEIKWAWIIAGAGIGSAIGASAARLVKMTSMPQMVGLFNGFGGLASLLVGFSEFHSRWAGVDITQLFTMVAIFLTVLTGGVTFSGSLVAYGKLAGMVTGKLLRFDGVTLDSAGQFLARSRKTVERGYDSTDEGQFEEAGYVFSVCGAAALYRRAALEQVAPDGQVFDDDFFAFHEDLDLGWRAQRLGWRGWYEPQARARHFRGSTDAARQAGSHRRRLTTLPDEVAYHAVKNRYLAMIKNDTATRVLLDLPFILGREILLWSFLLLRRPQVGWRVLTNGACRRRAWQHRRQLAVLRRSAASHHTEVAP